MTIRTNQIEWPGRSVMIKILPYRCLCVCLPVMFLFSCREPLKETSRKDIQILPRPQQITFYEGTFVMAAGTSIKAGDELMARAAQLRNYLSPATGFELPVNKRKAGGNTIELRLLGTLSDLGKEGYRLEITEKKVLITACHSQGIYWGIQTLRQLLPVQILRGAVVDQVAWELPCIKIVDKPRFAWRGLMIDYSRTFWSKHVTKKYIDAISYFKLNKLHMHLTDDQGWRLEIAKYPALTEIASKFDTVYHEPEERQGFYSREDIRELVNYARARGIELIPEIEMPGHTSEVFAAYPGLSCTGDTSSIHPFFEGPGIHEEIFCAGKAETFEFLDNVLQEVAELFPSGTIHIGGDEAPKAGWKACPDCQRVIRENGLKDEDELQGWFIGRIENTVKSLGKELIGWDEIMEGGLSETSTVMFWRANMENEVLRALDHGNGNKVILTPTSHCYFDYTYERIPTEKVYSLGTVIDQFEKTVPGKVLGVQGNFWSHIDRTEPGMDRQIFPRLLALAEVGWTEDSERDWHDFSVRLEHHYQSLDLLDIYFMNK